MKFEESIVHWRQPRRGCRGHIPQYFGWGDVNGNIPPILLRTFGYSRPILVVLRSLRLQPILFGYKTPPIRFSQAGGQSAHSSSPNLELALTPLLLSLKRLVGNASATDCLILVLVLRDVRASAVPKYVCAGGFAH